MTPWWRASALTAASTPPAAPSMCPVMLFVEETMSPFFAQSPKTFLMAFVSAMSPTGVEVPCAFTRAGGGGRHSIAGGGVPGGRGGGRAFIARAGGRAGWRSPPPPVYEGRGERRGYPPADAPC